MSATLDRDELRARDIGLDARSGAIWDYSVGCAPYQQNLATLFARSPAERGERGRETSDGAIAQGRRDGKVESGEVRRLDPDELGDGVIGWLAVCEVSEIEAERVTRSEYLHEGRRQEF